jgi:hypothetical protein
MDRDETLLHAILPQLVILFVACLLFFAASINIIPPPSDLGRFLVTMFDKYGLALIAISSFFESMVGLNVYYPGAFTILTGMALTAGNPKRAVATYFCIVAPAILANFLSFRLGNIQKNESRFTVISPTPLAVWFKLLLTYWHPQLASLTAYSLGSSSTLASLRFLKMALPVSLGWSLLWASIIYRFGLFFDLSGYVLPLFLGYLIIWLTFDIWRFWTQRPRGCR